MNLDPRNRSSPESKRAQGFAKRLVGILKGKSSNSWKGQESHWELIIGFAFFFGGLYFLFQFLAGV